MKPRPIPSPEQGAELAIAWYRKVYGDEPPAALLRRWAATYEAVARELRRLASLDLSKTSSIPPPVASRRRRRAAW